MNASRDKRGRFAPLENSIPGRVIRPFAIRMSLIPLAANYKARHREKAKSQTPLSSAEICVICGFIIPVC